MEENKRDDRLKIFMNRKKSNDYTTPVLVIILIVLGIAGSRSSNSFQLIPPSQIRDDSLSPAFQDDGPSTDGITTLTVTNAIPHPLSFRVRNRSTRKIRLNPCQGCKIYAVSNEIPENICKSGPTQTIAVHPGKNNVRWDYQNANIGSVDAEWNLLPGRKYSICLVLDLSKTRRDWDSQ